MCAKRRTAQRDTLIARKEGMGSVPKTGRILERTPNTPSVSDQLGETGGAGQTFVGTSRRLGSKLKYVGSTH